MKLKIGNLVKNYYLATLSLLICISVAGIVFYWNTGPVNVDNVAKVFESSIKLDEIKKVKYLSRVRSLVDNDKSRDAITILNKLEKKVKNINSVKEVTEYENLNSGFINVKKQMNNLISFPELNSIVAVLNKKVNSFHKFVVDKNWRTLTRISNRILIKVRSRKIAKKNFFNQSKISRLIKSISYDIKLMERVTLGSILSAQDKNTIIIKLKTLSTELKMLNNYLVHLRTFNSELTTFEKTFLLWVDKVGPEISLKKIDFEKNSQVILFSLIGMVLFIMVSILLGVFLTSISQKKDKQNIEEFVVDCIKNGLLPFKSTISSDMSEGFYDEIDSYRSYVHKRMSFGSIFQDAMPFASLLLNSNLQLVWANKLFYEDWNIADASASSNISWDYLLQFTNLGDEDPVLAAVRDNIAGIYQIQIRNNEDLIPYEMYVSPVEYMDEKRIMIIFYPLRSLEETLVNQTKALVVPISKTLEALTNGNFSNELCDKIKNDFKIAGIGELYDQFMKYNEYIINQKHGLMDEIEKLENDLYDQCKMIDDMKFIFDEKIELYSKVMSGLNNTKKSIVSIVEVRNEMEELYSNTISICKKLFKDQTELVTKSDKIRVTLEESSKTFRNVGSIRNDFKNLKYKIDDFKSKMMQSLNQLVVLYKADGTTGHNEAFSKVKTELKSFEQMLSTFSQVVTNLDVSLSKVDIILDGSQTPGMSILKEKLDNARNSIETDFFNVQRISRTGENKDEEMIKALKMLTENFGENRTKLHFLDQMIISCRRSFDSNSLPTIESNNDVVLNSKDNVVEEVVQ